MPRPTVESCAQCRARKVKCEKGRPICHNCKRLDFRCSFDSSEQDVEPSPTLPERRRGRACLECRSQKIRCRGTVPPCLGCLQRKKHCVYPPLGRLATAASSAVYPQPSSNDSVNRASAELSHANDPEFAGAMSGQRSLLESGFAAVPDSATSSRLAETYFLQVYPSFWYSFIRQECLDRSAEQEASQYLLLAVCIITATLKQDSETFPAQAETWAQELEQALLLRLESLSFPFLQALVLLVRYRIETGNFRRAFMLTAIAARAVFAMRLNYEKPALPVMARELRRRLVWSISAIESHFAVGLPELSMLPRESIHLNHPQSDDGFFSDPSNGNHLDLFDLFIELGRLRENFMRFTRKIPVQDPATIMETLIAYENELLALDYRIQQADRYSLINLRTAANQTQLLVVNVALHQTYCDMLRLFLMGYREAAPPEALANFDHAMISSRAQRAVNHALATVAIARDGVEHCSHLRLYDPDAAICVYHAAQIVSFASQPGRPEIQDKHNASTRVQWCLRFLKVFYPTSEFAKPMARDLKSLSRMTNPRSARLPSPREDTGPTDGLHGSMRLSIHSLLRRADFSDDDAEKVTPPAAGDAVDGDVMLDEEPDDIVPFFDPWMGWQGSFDPFGYLQLSDTELA